MNDIDLLVRIVSEGLQAKESERNIVAKLIAVGIPAAKATNLFQSIKSEIRRGVQSIVIPPADQPPDDPLLLAAYRAGQSAMRAASRPSWLKLVILASLAIVLVLLAIFMLRWLL